MVYEVIKCIKMTKDELLNKLTSNELNDVIDINHECLVLTSDFGLVKILEDGTISSENIIDTSNLVSNDTLNDKINNVLDTKGYLTEHQSLDGYATETYVTGEISKIQIPDVSQFITINDVHTHDNKSILDGITSEKIAAWDSASGGSEMDLSEYVKTTDLTNYALKSEIPDVSKFITEIPEEYITETELNNKGYLTEHQSLDGYAKTSDLPDMTDVITSSNILSTDLSTNITISDILTRLAQLEQPSA